MRPHQKNWALKVSTLVVVTACFVVMGAALLVSQNFRNILTLWGEDVQMTVYLSQDLSEKGRQDIESKIKENEHVAAVKFVTQEQALGDFRSQMASYAPDISQDEELLRLIPASLLVQLKSDVAAAEQTTVLQSMAGKLRQLEGVDEVSYGQDWVEKYAALVNAIELTLRALCLVILAASLFVMSNAIRASVQARKDEIVVLEMIGATPSMIRKPFLVEGAVLGVVSSVLSLGLCFAVYVGIKNLLTTKLSFLQLGEHIQFLGPVLLVVFVIAGTGLGALGSYLCVRRMNDGFAGSQG
ncbi:cell division protein FtsX [Bdellovibrio bacteriovorus]|uniref:cell division protein FtsX n=1 Tax=Bdellovibrio bacteriovorus TaxID=959 RepID=UPI0035A61CB6